jgi:ABC-type glycerol-3-phosphate transport system substrate-binding protein
VRKRWSATVAWSAAMLASLTACSSGGFQSSGGSGSTTSAHLRLLVNITPVLTKQFYQDLVAPYEAAHKGVTISIESQTNADVGTQLQQEIAAGNPPDLVSGSLTPDVVPQLTGLPDTDWVKNAPYAVQSEIGGKIWEAGSGIQVQSVIFYNKTDFTQAGITKMPTTLDELTQDFVKLKNAGFVPTQTAGDWVTGAQYEMMANSTVFDTSPNWFASRNKGTVQFAGSDWAKVLDVYDSWITQDLVTPNAMGLKYQDSINEFLAGKAATYIMGSWFIPTSDSTKKNFQVGAFAMPTLSGAPAPVAADPSIPWSILKTSKNQAADLGLLQYLVTDKTAVTKELKAEDNFRKGYSYPGTALNDAVSSIVAAAPKTVPASTGLGDNTAASGFGDELNELVQGLYTGQTPAQVLSALDSWYDANDTSAQ